MTAPLSDLLGPPKKYGAISQTPFGPGNNLIGTQFNTGLSPEAQAAYGQIGQGIQGLQGPDRQALANQTFQELTAQTQPQYQQDLRSVGQAAAQYGRLNSGLTTSQLGDVAQNRQQYLGNLAQQLSTQAAGQTLQDRLSALSGAEGGLGALQGADQTVLGNLQGERGYQQGLSQQAFNNALAAGGLTQPSPVALGIGSQYGQQAQGAYGSSGNLFQQLLRQYGPQPYTGAGSPTTLSGDPTGYGQYA